MKHNYFFKKSGLMLAVAGICSLNAFGQTWTGSAGDGNFTNPLNWGLPEETVLNASNSLVFTGTALHNDANIFKGSNNDNRATFKTEAGSTLTLNKYMMVAGSTYLNGTINITNTDYDVVNTPVTTEINCRPNSIIIGNADVGIINIGSIATNVPITFYSKGVLYIGTGLNGDGTVNIYNGGTLTVDNVLRLAHTKNPANGTLNISGGTVTAKGMQFGEAASNSTGNATINLYGGNLAVTGASELPRSGGAATAIVNIYNGNFSTTTTLTINNDDSKVEFKLNPDNSAPTGMLTTGTSTKAELQALIDVGKITKPAGYDWVWGTNAGVNLSIAPSTTPIELVSFDVNKTADGVKLNWTTATEKDNDKFIVEHSTDGKNFTNLTSIVAKNTASSYTFSHNSPANGVNYYKLTQVDFNGTKKVVGIKSINFKLSTSALVSVFPNPTSDIINVAVAGKENSTKTITITDLTGKVVLKQTASGANVVLNLKDKLVNGTYIIHVNADDVNESQKIIVK